MKLTAEEMHDFRIKKGYFLQSIDDIALTLGVESAELFLVVNGSEDYPDVAQAVKEWIE
jgi:hypothetical protein